MLKLNLGCGLQCPEGWVNIDSSIGVKLAQKPVLKKVLYSVVPKSVGLPNINWPANTKWMDLTKKFPYKNDSVDYIYSSHTFEHLTYKEVEFVLKECHRILKPNGIIRIIVPDFEDLVKSYLSNKKDNPKNAALKFHEYARYTEIPSPDSMKGLMKFYFQRKNNHAFLYDEEGLKFQFEKAGFKNAIRRKYRESKMKAIETIDIENRFVGSICLESEKL